MSAYRQYTPPLPPVETTDAEWRALLFVHTSVFQFPPEVAQLIPLEDRWVDRCQLSRTSDAALESLVDKGLLDAKVRGHVDDPEYAISYQITSKGIRALQKNAPPPANLRPPEKRHVSWKLVHQLIVGMLLASVVGLVGSILLFNAIAWLVTSIEMPDVIWVDD